MVDLTNYTPSELPRSPTYAPEFLALAELMKRTEKMQKLSVDLLRQEKITQAFLKRFMEEMLECYFFLEERTAQALKASGNHYEMAAGAMIKADNALCATDVVIEMGKILGTKSVNLDDTFRASPPAVTSGGQ
jgi:hypothetical protein